jgi:tetratricopeptide (TPR) repeat protein
VTLSGRLDDGEKLVHEAYELSRATDQPDALSWFGVQLYMVRYHQARLDEMLPLLSTSTAETPTLLAWHSALALAYAEVGQLDDAEAVVARIFEAGYPVRPQEPQWLIGMSCLGSALATIGRDVNAMTTAYDALASRAEIWSSIMPLSLGSNERVLGELAFSLGRVDDAIAHFERAVESNDLGPCPPFAARSRVGLIRCLTQTGDRERAENLAVEVRDAIARYGLTRVQVLLEQTGV